MYISTARGSSWGSALFHSSTDTFLKSTICARCGYSCQLYRMQRSPMEMRSSLFSATWLPECFECSVFTQHDYLLCSRLSCALCPPFWRRLATSWKTAVRPLCLFCFSCLQAYDAVRAPKIAMLLLPSRTRPIRASGLDWLFLRNRSKTRQMLLRANRSLAGVLAPSI
ncbi:hypothetical protein BDV96DRAFT_127023 [Lophiotrema nucula]|uniref:Uncharacterized protein n=1 Tax=Lophiotrema nucula TaxID=690887 RepID=A0A6A5ZRE7_9PLEO|nr:hypothetical protein BDV96DRAFT_127023 [Lophiotrema nucula]